MNGAPTGGGQVEGLHPHPQSLRGGHAPTQIPRGDTLGNCRNLSTPSSAKAMTPSRTAPPSITLFLWPALYSTLALMHVFWLRISGKGWTRVTSDSEWTECLSPREPRGSAPRTVPVDHWPGGERDWRDWGGEGLGGGNRASWGQGPSGTLHTVLTAPKLFVASDEGQMSSL